VKSVLSGKWIERAEVGGPGEFETMTDEELERALLDKIMKLGFGDRRDAALTQPGASIQTSPSCRSCWSKRGEP
jgi:hypothetical protein